MGDLRAVTFLRLCEIRGVRRTNAADLAISTELANSASRARAWAGVRGSVARPPIGLARTPDSSIRATSFSSAGSATAQVRSL